MHCHILLVIGIFMAASDAWALTAEKSLSGPTGLSSRITAIAENPSQPGQILAAADSSIYSTVNGRWSFLWQNHEKARIHDFRFFPELPGKIFALTSEGALFGDLSHQKWLEIPLAQKKRTPVLSFVLFPEDPNHWIAGTGTGLMESDNGGKTWSVFETFRDREPIIALGFHEKLFFIVTRNKVYTSSDLRAFFPLFTLTRENEEEIPAVEVSENNFEDSEDFQTGFLREGILSAVFSEKPEARLWLGTSEGVFECDYLKNLCRPLSVSGLHDTSAPHLVFSSEFQSLITGNSSGVYFYHAEEQRWQRIPLNMTFSGVKALKLFQENPETLAVATAGGLTLIEIPEIIMPSSHRPEIAPEEVSFILKNSFQREPSIRDIQKAAVKAFNAGHEKIHRWHKQSRLRALFPTLNFGRDFYTTSTVDLDRGGTSDPDLYIQGPDNYRNAWDATLQWDFSTLIWSSSQTSIDSRDKLTAEWRHELLGQVTRLYYERRRLQMELAFSAEEDQQMFYQKQLQLEELTALLDGMTDGYLSQALEDSRHESL